MKVIAITGMPGSGKSEAVEVARARGIPVVRMGDLIWEEVDRRGLPKDAATVGGVAHAMRQEHGPDVWADRTVERVRDLAAGADVVLIDGVRSPAEVAVLRRELGADFVCVAVVSPRPVRYARMLARGRADDPDDVTVLEERDRREESWGIRDVIAEADVPIENAGDLESFRSRFERLLV